MILSNKSSSATLWVRDTCLIVGLLPLMIIFITASLSFRFGCACLMWCYAASLLVLGTWFSLIDLGKNETLQQPNPKDQELVFHPCVNLHQEKKARLLLSCVSPRSVSCTFNLLARTNDFRICTTVHLKSISSLQDLQQSQCSETVPTCIVVQCFPHDNIV